MIGKIVIKGVGSGASYFKLYRIGWTIPENGEWVDQWAVKSSSDKISGTNTRYECNQFIAELSIPAYSNNYLEHMFMDGTSKFLSFPNDKPFEMTITFKEPLLAMQSFFYQMYTKNVSSYYINYLEIFDENDNQLFLSNEVCQNDFNRIDTPELESTKVYITNQLGTIETTDVCHLENVYSIDVLNPDQNCPEGTDIRYLLSFDNRATYKTYKEGSWITVDKSDILTQGMTREEICALRSSEYVLAMDTTHKTVDILVGLVTTDENTTPCINYIRASYYKITT